MAVNQFYSGNPYPAMATNNWNQPVMYPIAQGQFNNPQQIPPMQPQPQTPQIQTQPQQRGYISGRIIEPGEKVMANEVSGDGSISIFPISDRTKILVKEVNENGLIDTTTYVRASKDKKIDKEVSDILPTILARLENIEKMVKKNNSYHYKKKQEKKEDSNE